MLKNKFKIIAILMVIILCLMVPIVRAENEDVATNDDVALISEDAGEEAANTSLPKSEPELKKEDVYLAFKKDELGSLVGKIELEQKEKYKSGDQVGNYLIYLDNTLLYKEKIYIQKTSNKTKGVFQYLKEKIL